MDRFSRKVRITSSKLKLMFYMAEKGVLIREPNTLIEAGQKLSKEELIIWMWSLLKAKPKGLKEEVLKKEDIEKYKQAKKLPLMVSFIKLPQLAELFPEYFKSRKLKYYKELIKKMEKKIAFEVKLDDYLAVLKKLGYEFLIDELDIPTDTKKVKYHGISIIFSVTLFEDASLKIIFSPYITPLLLELKAWYTTYDFLDILNLKFKHSIVLYRLIKEKLGLKQNPFIISIEELQKIFNVDYKTWSNLKTFVIKPAINDINKHTKYEVSIKTIRKGRGGKVKEIMFFVREKKFLNQYNLAKNLKTILENITNSFNQAGEEITLKEFAMVLLNLKRINPAVAIWFLLHYPEGEPRLYAWEEQNTKIQHPNRFLESLIKDKNPELDWLLDQRTKDLIYEELKKIAGEEFQKQKELEELVRELQELEPFLRLHEEQIAKKLNVKHPISYVNQLIAKKDVEKLKQTIEIIKKFLSEKSSSQDDEEFF